MPGIAAYAVQLVLLAPDFIKAGLNLYEIFTHASGVIKAAQDENRDITDAEWAELNSRIDVLRAERDKAAADLT